MSGRERGYQSATGDQPSSLVKSPSTYQLYMELIDVFLFTCLFIYYLFFFFETRSYSVSLAILGNALCRAGRPQTHKNLLTSASLGLGLKVFTTDLALTFLMVSVENTNIFMFMGRTFSLSVFMS